MPLAWHRKILLLPIGSCSVTGQEKDEWAVRGKRHLRTTVAGVRLMQPVGKKAIAPHSTTLEGRRSLIVNREENVTQIILHYINGKIV